MNIKKTQLKRRALSRRLRRAGLLGVGAVLALALAGCSKGGGEIASVNGEAITRTEVNEYLEATSGDGALRQLIDYDLVMQKLESNGLKISDEDVNKEIEEMRQADPQTDEIIQLGGPRLEALKRRVRYNLALNLLLTQDVKTDDDALKAWFEKHRSYYDAPLRLRVGFLLSSSKERADTMEKQLQEKTKSFQELAEAQQKANDEVGQQSTAESPSYMLVDSLPSEIRGEVADLKKGEVSKVLSVGDESQEAYLIVRVTERLDAQKADFAANHERIELDYKLEQVARKLNEENPSNPNFDKTVEQVKAVLQQQSQDPQGPGYRDILDFINQTAVNNLLQALRTAAQVDIKDPSYKAVGDDFRPVPGMEGAAPAAPAPEAAP